MKARRLFADRCDVDGLGLVTVCLDDLWVTTTEGVLRMEKLGTGSQSVVAAVHPSAPLVSTRGGRVAILTEQGGAVLRAPELRWASGERLDGAVKAIGSAGPWLVRIVTSETTGSALAQIDADEGTKFSLALRGSAPSAHRFVIPVGESVVASSCVETLEDGWTEVLDMERRSLERLEAVLASCAASTREWVGEADGESVIVSPSLEYRPWRPLLDAWGELPPFAWGRARVAIRTDEGRLAIVDPATNQVRWVERERDGLSSTPIRPARPEFDEVTHIHVATSSEGRRIIVLIGMVGLEVFVEES